MKRIFKKSDNNIEKNDSSFETNKSLIFYGIAFIILVLISIIFNYLNNASIDAKKEMAKENRNITSSEETNINELINALKNNNYDLELSINTESDILNLIIRRENVNRELISVTYRENISNYYRNNHDIYLLQNNDYRIQNNVNFYNGYDETFTIINNILKLIEESKNLITLEEENYKINRYKIDVQEVLEILQPVYNLPEEVIRAAPTR